MWPFILTMWYVNPKELDKFKNSNYAFILTMWYVNQFSEYEIKDVFEAFILTMWYVNASSIGKKNDYSAFLLY